MNSIFFPHLSIPYNTYPRVQQAARDFGLDGVDFASCGRCG
jgi:hypothetical protein